MTTRRKKIKLRAYDYLTGQALVVARLKERGEDGKMDRHETDRVDLIIEVCADHGVTTELAEAAMREVADSIVAERGRTLFAAFDERDNLGDDSMAQIAVEEARRAVA